MLDERVIIDQIPSGIVVLDNTQNLCYANDWVIETSGFSRQELYGVTPSKLLSGFEFRNIKDSEDLTTAVISKHHSLTTTFGKQIPVTVAIRSHMSGSNLNYIYLSIMITPSLVCQAETVPVAQDKRERFFGIIGKNQHMQELYNFIEMAAATDTNVVIQGESGTGKELVASAIHHASLRHDKEFVRVNCAALTETLLESELFGHAKGAFTGAYRDHIGKFEYANQGTIFLDEIGEISQTMQVKLLRVLQERIIVRVGDNREIPVDVRVVVATNKNLRNLVTKGKFREDLFYRLNVFPIHLPPLRDRGTDIPLLIQHFINKFRNRNGTQIFDCSPDAMRILMAYCWPGNVRELENTIEHAFVLCRKNEIQVVDLPHELKISAVREGICAGKVAGIEQTFYPSPVRSQKTSGRLVLTREMIESELEKTSGNKTAAAKALGISKVGLWKNMKKLGMMP
jgi:transcriptional regulator with PAS, ATPase and Fis domain